MATVTLYTRFGSCVDDPSAAVLDQAIGEMFGDHSTDPPDNEGSEPPSASLDYRSAEGDQSSRLTLDLSPGGKLTLLGYADSDDAEPEFTLLSKVTRQEALRLWSLLRDGDIDAVMREPWRSEG